MLKSLNLIFSQAFDVGEKNSLAKQEKDGNIKNPLLRGDEDCLMEARKKNGIHPAEYFSIH